MQTVCQGCVNFWFYNAWSEYNNGYENERNIGQRGRVYWPWKIEMVSMVYVGFPVLHMLPFCRFSSFSTTEDLGLNCFVTSWLAAYSIHSLLFQRSRLVMYSTCDRLFNGNTIITKEKNCINKFISWDYKGYITSHSSLWLLLLVFSRFSFKFYSFFPF